MSIDRKGTAMLAMKLSDVSVEPVMSPADVIKFRNFIGKTHVSAVIQEYIVRIVRATRGITASSLPVVKEMVLHGASPRAAQHILALSRTTAFMHGRDYVLPDDVKQISLDALRHRLIRTVRAEVENITTDEIIEEIFSKVPIP